MLSVAIVEDEKAVSGLLQRYVKKFSEETGEAFKVSVYSNGVLFLSDTKQDFDIVLMDIQMPVMDGMRTAKKLRAQNANVAIIFVTNMAKYAVEGYEVNATDFIVKPVDYLVFALKFEKAVRMQNSRKNDVAILNMSWGEVVKIKISTIRYIEGALHFVIYHTDSGNYRLRASMKDTEKKFEGKGFARCNTSFLVNLARVDRIYNDSVIVDGDELFISHNKKKGFLDAFSVYYG